MPSRRQFLRAAGRSATVAGLTSLAGCADRIGSASTTSAPGRRPTDEWRRTFGTEHDEYGLALTVSDGHLYAGAEVEISDERGSDAGLVRFAPASES